MIYSFLIPKYCSPYTVSLYPYFQLLSASTFLSPQCLIWSKALKGNSDSRITSTLHSNFQFHHLLLLYSMIMVNHWWRTVEMKGLRAQIMETDSSDPLLTSHGTSSSFNFLLCKLGMMITAPFSSAWEYYLVCGKHYVRIRYYSKHPQKMGSGQGGAGNGGESSPPTFSIGIPWSGVSAKCCNSDYDGPIWQSNELERGRDKARSWQSWRNGRHHGGKWHLFTHLWGLADTTRQ